MDNKVYKLLLLFLAVLCLCAAPASAQSGYYNTDEQPAAAAADDDGGNGMPDTAIPPSHTITVTSIEKCYAQLGHAETLDIERNFVKPYEECQRRLALKLQAQQQLKAGQQQKPPAPASTKDAAGGTDIMNPPPAAPSVPIATPAPTSPTGEGLYYRVQKDPVPPGNAQ